MIQERSVTPDEENPQEDEHTGSDQPALAALADDTTAEGIPESRIELPDWAVMSSAALVALAILIQARFSLAGVVAGSVGGVLVVLSAIDLRERRLPNAIVLPAAAFALVANTLLDPGAIWLVAALGTAVLLALPLLLNPRAIGLGDVKLGLLIGAATGSAVPDALVIGGLALVPFALAMLARHGSAARKATLPLGPFLAFGTIVVLMLQAPA